MYKYTLAEGPVLEAVFTVTGICTVEHVFYISIFYRLGNQPLVAFPIIDEVFPHCFAFVAFKGSGIDGVIDYPTASRKAALFIISNDGYFLIFLIH